MTSLAGLQAAVNAGGIVKLGGDITIEDGNYLVVDNGVSVILDLNGYTLSSDNFSPISVTLGGICTVKNGTVTNTASMNPTVWNGGTLTVQNYTLNANNYYPL